MLNIHTKAELQFVIQRDIGEEGKNSDVFVAHDKQLDAELVVKRVEKARFVGDGLAEFYAEAKVLNLSSHSNVVPIHYACEDDHYVYMALPYYQAGSLKKLMSQGFLTTRQIIRYACNFLSGLHHIHTKGLLHFDIKPDNILLSYRNEAVLSDFGLAAFTDVYGLAKPNQVYTKMLPPEHLENREYSTAFDIYQVGLTLYRMANGDQRFNTQLEGLAVNGVLTRDAFYAAVKEGRFPDRQAFLEHIPQRLRKVIRKCLEVDPDDRYQSVLQIVNDLSDVDGYELDWVYTENHADRTWSKENDKGVQYKCVARGTELTTTKTGPRGPEQRMRAYCKDNASRADIQNVLRSY